WAAGRRPPAAPATAVRRGAGAPATAGCTRSTARRPGPASRRAPDPPPRHDSQAPVRERWRELPHAPVPGTTGGTVTAATDNGYPRGPRSFHDGVPAPLGRAGHGGRRARGTAGGVAAAGRTGTGAGTPG